MGSGEQVNGPRRHPLFPAAELAPGELRRARAGSIDVVVLRTPDGRVRALRDRCSHEGAPLSSGWLRPLMEGDDVGEISTSESCFVVRCPWHRYEFDVDSGRCPADPARARVKAYDVIEEDGQLVLLR